MCSKEYNACFQITAKTCTMLMSVTAAKTSLWKSAFLFGKNCVHWFPQRGNLTIDKFTGSIVIYKCGGVRWCWAPAAAVMLWPYLFFSLRLKHVLIYLFLLKTSWVRVQTVKQYTKENCKLTEKTFALSPPLKESRGFSLLQDTNTEMEIVLHESLCRHP